jgi:hypothetical protein
LKTVTKEFGVAAEKIGRIIIEQSTLPTSSRRYQPLQGKGVGKYHLIFYLIVPNKMIVGVGVGKHEMNEAGGEKYLVSGIFIKLTRDVAGIYGGDAPAAKAAKHEIRSLQELIACDVKVIQALFYFTCVALLIYCCFFFNCDHFVVLLVRICISQCYALLII